MSNSICKMISHFRSLTKASPNHNLFYLKYHPLTTSTAPKPLTTLPNQESFRVSYLINSCGLTPEKALSVSRKVKFETPQNPDLVIASFKNLGFNDTQISTIVCKFPAILSSKPEKTIVPKIHFFTSVGLSNAELTRIITGAPGIWRWDLEKKIIPIFNLFRGSLQSNERTFTAIRKMTMVWGHDYEACMIHNVKVLRELGVPESNIMTYVSNQPSLFTTKRDKFQGLVKEVVDLGFNPLKVNFIIAIHVLRSLSKSKWEKKVEFFKNWGWSEEDIRMAFEKHPWFMSTAEDKLSATMDLLINKLGFENSDILRRPLVLSLSFEKRVVPRCSVYQVMLEKGLIDKKFSLSVILEAPDKRFLNKIRNCYKEAAPELLKLYQQKLELSKCLV